MGAIIIHQRPVACWYCKVTKEKHLLSIVMIHEEFCFKLLSEEQITKISLFSILTATMSFADDCLWKSMIPPSSITLEQNMWSPTSFHVSHSVMCCQLQWGRMLLSSLTLPFKAFTWAMTITCSSAYSTLFPSIAENILVDLEWIQSQQNMGTKYAMKAAIYPEWYFNEIIDDLIFDHCV